VGGEGEEEEDGEEEDCLSWGVVDCLSYPSWVEILSCPSWEEILLSYLSHLSWEEILLSCQMRL